MGRGRGPASGRGGRGRGEGIPAPPVGAPAAPAAAVTPTEGGQLTAAMLAAAPAEQQKQLLGERLFPLVANVQVRVVHQLSRLVRLTALLSWFPSALFNLCPTFTCSPTWPARLLACSSRWTTQVVAVLRLGPILQNRTPVHSRLQFKSSPQL